MSQTSSRRKSSQPRQRSRRTLSTGLIGAALDAARGQAGVHVGEFVEQVKQEGQQFLSGRKSRVADQFTNVGGAIRRAADKLHDTDSGFIAGYVDQAADKVEDVARYIEENDLNDVVEDVGVLARQQPLLFGGAMFLAGLAAARFIKAATDGPSGVADAVRGRGRTRR